MISIFILYPNTHTLCTPDLVNGVLIRHRLRRFAISWGFISRLDAYEFMDQVENPEDALTEIKYNLLAGNGMLEYAAFLKDVKEESRELAPKAEALLGKLKEYSPELTEGIQPMVKIQFS